MARIEIIRSSDEKADYPLESRAASILRSLGRETFLLREKSRIFPNLHIRPGKRSETIIRRADNKLPVKLGTKTRFKPT